MSRQDRKFGNKLKVRSPIYSWCRYWRYNFRCWKIPKRKESDIKIWGIDTYGSVFKKYHETGIFDENEIYSYITEGIGGYFTIERRFFFD
jgi:hypothetical protein